MPQDVLAIDHTVARMGGDTALAANLLRIYLEEIPKKIAALRAAWAAQETYQVERLAHAIKGSSATVGAEALRQAAASLEMAAKSEDRAAMETAYAALGPIVDETLRIVGDFCRQHLP